MTRTEPALARPPEGKGVEERRGGSAESGPGAGGGGSGGGPRATEQIARHRHDEYRRAVWVGMGLSLLVHAVLVLLISRGLVIPPARVESPLVRRPLPPEGLEVVRARPREQPPEEVTTPEERPTPERPTREEEEEEEGQPIPVPVPEEEAPLSNAERLRPREGDPRLWQGPDETPGLTLDGLARADSALRAVLRSYLDSLRLSEEQREAARDWTFGDDDERWGVSPAGIHLGDVTIPIPLSQLLQPTGPLRRQLEREVRERYEIQLQEALQAAEEVREERIEEMRERSRERAEESKSDTASSDGSGG